MWQLLRLWWRYRGLKVGRPWKYAATAMTCQSHCDLLRRLHPAANFDWAFQPTPLDSEGRLVAFYEHARGGVGLDGKRLEPFRRRLWHGDAAQIKAGELILAYRGLGRWTR